jgi:hypothetical protein
MENNKNYEYLHHFVEGLKGDFDQHAESKDSYQDSKNGRLYSHNGAISFSSIKGTKEVYVNNSIVKYLGYWAFEDELIIFVKGNLPIGSIGNTTVTYQTVNNLVANSFSVSETTNSITIDLEPNVVFTTFELPIYSQVQNPLEFEIPFSCDENPADEIDLSEYYEEVLSNANFQVCQLEGDQSFENNAVYIDLIYSLKKDNQGNITDRLIWSGLLNWPLNGKICAHGIFENNFFKKIYFTDYLNSFKVINLKDTNLLNRNAEELSNFQSSVLLQPLIISINNDGQIKAGSTFYAYRLFTDNGQVTEFSPFSETVKILENTDGLNYSGGDISEITDRSVSIRCNVVNFKNFSEIQCIAIEYEALGSPTAIRSLGTKKANLIVDFKHFGNESEFDSDLSLSKILERQNTWQYCSDISSVYNKLVAVGLRNKPIPSEISTLNKSFTLHGWDVNGETHNCLINSKPWKYRYIDITNNAKMFFLKRKLYTSIQVFENFTIKIKNTQTGENIINSSIGTSNLVYNEYLTQVYNWLNNIQLTPLFQSYFPNLKIELIQNKLLFSPIDSTVNTDMDFYKFEYSTEQVTEAVEEDIQFVNLIVNGPLVYGAESLGFNQGNGIRVTYETELEEVLQKATAKFPTAEPILNIKAPSGKKGFLKGEIYRLGLQIFDKNGYQLFVIPLGDIMVPALNEPKKYINDAGNAIIINQTYANSRVIGDKLMAERTTLKVEVRLNCEVQKLISMYQLVYVEREEENKTILCQGISAPMERVNSFKHSENVQIPEPVANKWCLPYYGGPTYDKKGLERFDEDPNSIENVEWQNRVTTSRKLIYFDSPDIIYNKVSTTKLNNGSISRVGRLNTDHSRNSIRQSTGEVYPAFSRKIYKTEHAGVDNRKSYAINVSVFLERNGYLNDSIPIDHAQELNYGEIVSASKFNLSQEVSNNAMTMQKEAWFYSAFGRRSSKCGIENGARSEIFNTTNYSPGFKTVVIKCSENIFTNEFIGQIPITVNPEIVDPYNANLKTYDTHGLINIVMNNRENVYGGRTELSFSKNVYVPLGKTIPVLKKTNNTQVFKIYGDTYSSLYIRNKNQYNNDPVEGGFSVNNAENCIKNQEVGERKNGAWCYAVVLETAVESKWNHNESFYKNGKPFDWLQLWNEFLNEAYLQENTLRSYIPQPFKFRDDPNMGNIVAVSETKLNGDYVDKWSQFKVNNFYELERDKGVGYNLAKHLNDLYVMQEHQSSKLLINQNVMIPTSQGEISMQQGNGDGVTNHQIISDYGTSIRRSVIEMISGSKMSGFTFFDEKRIEWIKMNQPFFIERELHLKMRELFENDKIIDTEGYYDDEYKETNIRLRTEKEKSYTISFNEKLMIFNGFIDYNEDIYIVWNDGVYAPKLVSPILANKLHELNKGIYLNFFEEQKIMKILVTCSPNPEMLKIFKAWAANINISYPVKKITIKTSLGQVRVIDDLHHRYQIQEGKHNVPYKNRNDWDDLRGEWATMEFEIESKNDKKVDVFSFINFVRHSYQ